MSELIVQMEMPKNCIDCCVRLKCDLYMNELMKPSKQRNFKAIKPLASNGCLIRGVLPDEHGDLVDRNVMHKEIQLWKSNATDTITKCFLYHVERLLMSIKSIIEAEKGEYE